MLARVLPSWLRGYETVPYVDITAARMLDELAGDLRRDGVARDVGQVRDVLRRTGAEAPLVQVHRTIQDAGDTIIDRLGGAASAIYRPDDTAAAGGGVGTRLRGA